MISIGLVRTPLVALALFSAPPGDFLAHESVGALERICEPVIMGEADAAKTLSGEGYERFSLGRPTWSKTFAESGSFAINISGARTVCRVDIYFSSAKPARDAIRAGIAAFAKERDMTQVDNETAVNAAGPRPFAQSSWAMPLDRTRDLTLLLREYDGTDSGAPQASLFLIAVDD